MPQRSMLASPRRWLSLLLVAAAAACGDGAGSLTSPDHLSIVAAIGTDPRTGAWIETDQDDYLPGDQVAITGGGWAPSETVTLKLTREPDVAELGVVQWTLTADSSGKFATGFEVLETDFGATFTLVGSGPTSGSVATVVFYDYGLDKTAITNPTTSQTVASGTALSLTVGASRNTCTTGGCGGTTNPVWKGTGYIVATSTSASRNWSTATCINSTDVTVSSSDITSPNTTTVSVPTTGLAAGTYYVYVIASATDACGNPRATESSPLTVTVTAPDLTVAKSHTGNFTRGSTGTYTIAVSNEGSAASSGTVTVTDVLPSQFTFQSVSGTGWSCTTPSAGVNGTVECTRSDALSAGGSYASISLVVNVAASGGSNTVTNTATISGGGDSNTANNESADETTLESGGGGGGGAQPSATLIGSAAATTSTANTSIYGEDVTFSVEVNTGNAAANDITTGTVDFKIGGTSCADADSTLTGGAALTLNAQGQSSFTYNDLAAGSHTIRACYSGWDGTGQKYDPSAASLTKTVQTAKITSTAEVSDAEVSSAAPPPSVVTQQYSDHVVLETELDMTAPGDMNGQTLTGTVEFKIGSRTVETVSVSTATLPLTVATTTALTALTEAASATNYPVEAIFTSTNSNFEDGTQTDDEVKVTREDGEILNVSHPSTIISPAAALQDSFTVTFSVRERKPEPNGGSTAAGDISNASVNVTMRGVGSNTTITLVCTGGTDVADGDGYETKPWSCTNDATIPVDAYEVTVAVTGDYYEATPYSSTLGVYDPSQGLPSGGGFITLDGDKVHFAIQWNTTKSSRLPKGNMIAVRHYPDGSSCRIKSMNMEPPAVSLAHASAAFITTRAVYSCSDADGNSVYSVGARTMSGTMYDPAVPKGTPQNDRIYFTIDLPGSAPVNAFVMPVVNPGATTVHPNAHALRGGNIHVPKPTVK